MPTIDEQFNLLPKERLAELRAEARKNRTLTRAEENEDSIGFLYEKIEKIETEVKRILEHLGMKAKSK